jgi:oligogalacturonide lyase
MAQHNYKLDSNVCFSPNKSLVVFTSNMFVPGYVFAAATAKATGWMPGEQM